MFKFESVHVDVVESNVRYCLYVDFYNTYDNLAWQKTKMTYHYQTQEEAFAQLEFLRYSPAFTLNSYLITKEEFIHSDKTTTLF